MDQIPLQNRGAKQTVEYIGKKSVHVKNLKIDFARRFYTFYVTVRAIPDQNFDKFHEISSNFTGTSVKLSVQHMRYFSVLKLYQLLNVGYIHFPE